MGCGCSALVVHHHLGCCLAALLVERCLGCVQDLDCHDTAPCFDCEDMTWNVVVLDSSGIESMEKMERDRPMLQHDLLVWGSSPQMLASFH